MVLLGKSRQAVGLLVKQAYRFGFVVLLLAGSAIPSPAQLKALAPRPPKAEPAATIDPLGRETPRGTVIGFLKYEKRGDYATAARYLQLPPGQNTNLVQLAKELGALFPYFSGKIDLLSDDPNGTVDSGLPPGRVRAGVVTVDAVTADVILVRVDDPASGKIWLVSRQTLENIPKLYALAESKPPTAADRFRTFVRSGPAAQGCHLGNGSAGSCRSRYRGCSHGF